KRRTKPLNATPHSAESHGRPHDVPENAELQLKRLRAVVLVVAGSHHDNQIELRNDANRLAASTQRANPVDFTPIDADAAEPPEISMGLIVRRFDAGRGRGVDPAPRNDLTFIPAPAREHESSNLRHFARS